MAYFRFFSFRSQFVPVNNYRFHLPHTRAYIARELETELETLVTRSKLFAHNPPCQNSIVVCASILAATDDRAASSLALARVLYHSACLVCGWAIFPSVAFGSRQRKQLHRALPAIANCVRPSHRALLLKPSERAASPASLSLSLCLCTLCSKWIRVQYTVCAEVQSNCAGGAQTSGVLSLCLPECPH